MSKIKVSKLNAYAIIGKNPEGVSIDKIVAHAVVGTYDDAISFSKLNTYAVLSSLEPSGATLSISKLVAYAVLSTEEPIADPVEGASSLFWLTTALRMEKTMAIYGVEQTVHYIAWDTDNNAMKTGDVANHTIYWVKDGTAAAASNSPAEVDAVNTPGLYKLTITAAEAQCLKGFPAGKSSTENIVLFGVPESFLRLPNVAPGANGGLPTTDANNRVAGIQGTKNTLDDLNDLSADDVGEGSGGPTFITLTSLGRTINVNEITSVKDLSDGSIQILLTSNKLIIVTDPTDIDAVNAVFTE